MSHHVVLSWGRHECPQQPSSPSRGAHRGGGVGSAALGEGDDGWSDVGLGWLKQIVGGAVCKSHPSSYLMLQCDEGGIVWRRLHLGSSGGLGPLGVPALLGAQGAQMKLTYGGPLEGCRSSLRHCGSFHGRKFHPCQAQPKTCWPFGNLLQRGAKKIRIVVYSSDASCVGLHD